MRLKLRYKLQNHLLSLRAFSILLWEEKTNSFKTCNWSTNCSTYSNIWRPTKTNREWFIIIMRSLRKQPFQNNIATTKRSHMTSPNYKRVQPSTPQKSGPLMQWWRCYANNGSKPTAERSLFGFAWASSPSLYSSLSAENWFTTKRFG